MKGFYVTYKVVYADYPAAVTGVKEERFAIKCKDEADQSDVYKDVSSLDGASYVNTNRTGKFVKGTKVMTSDEYFNREKLS